MPNAHKSFKTSHATIDCDTSFTALQIDLKDPSTPLDLMDIKEIYAAFFRDWLLSRIKEMKPDDVIKLGYYVGEKYS